MKTPITFKMDGPIFNDGIPLHLVNIGLTQFLNIIDKSYLVATNKKKLTQKDRKNYQIVSHKFEKGSFLTEVEIVLATTQLTLPFISTLGPQNIWDYTKDTFNFLKLIFSASKQGLLPT